MTFKNASEPQALLRLVDHLRHRARKERETKERQNHIREALQQRLNHPDRQPPLDDPERTGWRSPGSGLIGSTGEPVPPEADRRATALFTAPTGFVFC